MGDRSKPPEGYRVESDCYPERDPGYFGAYANMSDDNEFRTKAGAIAATWAHRDRVVAEAVREMYDTATEQLGTTPNGEDWADYLRHFAGTEESMVGLRMLAYRIDGMFRALRDRGTTKEGESDG